MAKAATINDSVEARAKRLLRLQADVRGHPVPRPTAKAMRAQAEQWGGGAEKLAASEKAIAGSPDQGGSLVELEQRIVTFLWHPGHYASNYIGFLVPQVFSGFLVYLGNKQEWRDDLIEMAILGRCDHRRGEQQNYYQGAHDLLRRKRQLNSGRIW